MSFHFRHPGDPGAPIGGPDDEEGATRLLPEGRPVEYHIGRRLGSGGFAEVYAAEQRVAGAAPRPVALKRLLPSMRQDPMRRRLLNREAHLAAQLSHENIVRVLDLVDLGDELAIVMELVEGMSVNHLIHRLAQRSQRLTLGAVTHIMQGLFRALSYLENPPLLGQRPLVHADISLENVMVTADGAVKLLDFGIAGLDHSTPVDDEEGLTSIHQVAGKRSYAPPEGAKAAPTVSSDLYAAGVCFWELIAGCRFPVLPPGIGSREMGSLIAFAGEGQPEEVWTTLKLCLSVDPADRPGSAARGFELMQAVSLSTSFRQEALGQLVRSVQGPGPGQPGPGQPVSRPSIPPMPADWPRPSEQHDVVVSLVERLRFAFCAHRVLAYEPVPPEDIEDMGGHEFILRIEKGAAGDAPPDYLLREGLDRGFVEEDGALLFRVQPPGLHPHVFVVQPGDNCVYDALACRVMHSLLRPEAPPL